jgi:hypothetical protein
MGVNLNNYNVTVVTNVGTYNYKNVIAYTEIQARKIAEYDITQATKAEVLESSVVFKKIEKEESNNG